MSGALAGLRVIGLGAVTGVLGVDQTALANAAGWKRIEVVGLPFAAGEAALPVYDPQAQGLEPPTLDGESAAGVRLAISQLLSVPIPATGVAGLAAPPWDAPDPALFERNLELTFAPK